MAMSDLTSARSAMQQAELLIRSAVAEPSPADRTAVLLQSYRLAHPDVQIALVMGLITRMACADGVSVVSPAPQAGGRG